MILRNLNYKRLDKKYYELLNDPVLRVLYIFKLIDF